MRIISVVLLLCISFNSFAATGTVQELERQLDELNYSLTVEWDQKDKKFYDDQTKSFLSNIDTLYKEKGLSSEDVMLVLEKRIKNKAQLDALKLKMSLMGDKVTPTELMESLKTDTLYSQGASWNGDTILWVVGGLAVVIVALLVGHDKWWKDNHECAKYDQAEQCVDEYDCQGEHCYYDGTYCSIITRCTKYVRK